jgi:hypothetical protein
MVKWVTMMGAMPVSACVSDGVAANTTDTTANTSKTGKSTLYLLFINAATPPPLPLGAGGSKPESNSPDILFTEISPYFVIISANISMIP